MTHDHSYTRPTFPDMDFPRTRLAQFKSQDGGIDWVRVLDYIKDQAGFTQDKVLAEYLGIPASTLSGVRLGRTELSGLSKMFILDKFGFHLIVDAGKVLMGDDLAAKARRAVQRQAQRLATNK